MKLTQSRLLFLMALAFLISAGTARACDGTGLVFGPEDAPLTIQEFSDLKCQYCRQGSKLMKQVLDEYPGKVKVVFRNRPLPFHGPIAVAAAKALTAVSRQCRNLAYAYQARLFEQQDTLSEPALYQVAQDLGVDVERMKADMASDTVAKQLEEDAHQAELAQVQGTPTFLIGSEKVTGALPYSEIKKVIDRQLGAR